METALLVCKNGQAAEWIRRYLTDFDVCGASSAGEARRALLEREFDIIVVNSPLADEDGVSFAFDAGEKTSSGVVLIVKGEEEVDIAESAADCGVAVVAKPLSRQTFVSAIRLVSAAHRLAARMRNENIKLRDKIEEIRLVDRAKLYLVRFKSMTEPEAHRYIEKKAMDLRRTKRDVAEGILSLYENKKNRG